MFVDNNNKCQIPRTPEEFQAMGGIEAGQKLLEDSKLWSTIPLLNYTPLHHLKDNTLVRFRGMIQDMLDPEIYLERYNVKTTNGEVRAQDGKYRDCLVLNTGEVVDNTTDSNVYGERRTLFVVSLPGQNQWSKDHEEKCNQSNEQALPVQQTDMASSVKKRPAPADNDDAAMEVDNATATSNDHADEADSNKRQCVSAAQTGRIRSSSLILGADYLLNSPIPERPSKACIIKLYNDFDGYILNELIDVIGFLSVDPSLDASTIDTDNCQDFNGAGELQAKNPPPSLIPRLHAIGVKKLPHANPLLDQSLHSSTGTTEPLNMASVQKDIRILLSLCLFNDELAAEYLLSHLISNVYGRTEMQSIGKFALNLCNLPKECLELYTTKLYEILELLLPASHYLPLTLDTMNTSAFAPKKDYETNKLVSGLLQLAPHTHLVLDETRLQAGKLDAGGVMGIQHLAHLINNQQIKCDFQYYQIDYDVNIPVLMLSEGRSMLPTDFALPLQTDAESVKLLDETLKAARHYLHATRLEQFRRYLTQARLSNFNVTEANTDLIQNDFVEMRKNNSLNTGEDLHALLVLTRLLAIARGKEHFDDEIWSLAKDYESKRRQRLQALPQACATTRARN